MVCKWYGAGNSANRANRNSLWPTRPTMASHRCLIVFLSYRTVPRIIIYVILIPRRNCQINVIKPMGRRPNVSCAKRFFFYKNLRPKTTTCARMFIKCIYIYCFNNNKIHNTHTPCDPKGSVDVRTVYTHISSGSDKNDENLRDRVCACALCDVGSQWTPPHNIARSRGGINELFNEKLFHIVIAQSAAL